MSEVVVAPLGPSRFGVEVREGPVVTNHKVVVPDGLVDDLGLAGIDGATIVEESFKFLLEREPASSILGDFPLDRIASYFPEYYEELRTRLGA